MTGTTHRRAIVTGALLVAVAAACKGSTAVKPPTRATIADSADQVMYGVRTLLTDRGVLRAELLSDTAYVFDENTRFELRGVHTTFYRTTGAKDAVLTSKEGTYRTNANNMQARKNVVVLSEDGRQLTTAELRFDQTTNEIAGDSAFVLTEPGRRLEGIGFRSDPNMNNVRVLRAAQGSVGPVSVPATGGPGAPPGGVPPHPQSQRPPTP
jgi:LPS export ABC transporter protein LptC